MGDVLIGKFVPLSVSIAFVRSIALSDTPHYTDIKRARI